MEKSRYKQITNDIEVTVEPAPVPKASQPESNRFAFSYTVTIKNNGALPVQLLERYWMVKSAGETVAEVVGPGVVGEQPILNTGEEFTYTSGAVIEDPVGSMHGRYTFRAANGSFVEATIPQFDLLFPAALN
jgi:ApaG protein